MKKPQDQNHCLRVNVLFLMESQKISKAQIEEALKMPYGTLIAHAGYEVSRENTQRLADFFQVDLDTLLTGYLDPNPGGVPKAKPNFEQY